MNSKSKKMKYIYRSICLVALGLVAVNATAQQDTTLTRHVMMEREYTPTLNDASRINQTPAVFEYQVRKANPTYTTQAPSITVSRNKLGKVSSGEIRTDVVRNRKRGYLMFGIGNYMNIEGVAGYRIVDSKKDKLDFFASYDMTDGKLKYAEKGYDKEKQKAKRNDLKFNLNYKHAFKPSLLSIDASFLNAGYNYYGNSFLPPQSITGISNLDQFDYTTKQNTRVFSFKAGLESSKENEGHLRYKGSAGYTYFKNKHGLLNEINGIPTNQQGMKGGIINVDVDLSAELSADSWLGVRGGILNQTFSKPDQIMKDTLHYFTNITANPYFRFEGLNWEVEFGAILNSVFDRKNKFTFAPNILASLKINEVNNLYANITGGVNNNTFTDILLENRYASPLGRVKYSRTQYDISLGFKSGIVPGFQFDVFGGYKNTKDEHLYVASPTVLMLNSRWANVGVPIYADLATGHVGGMVKTQLIPHTTLSAKATAFFYSMKNLDNTTLPATDDTKKEPWGKPKFELELGAQIKLFDPIIIYGDYILSTGRKTLVKGKSVKMKKVNELNAKVDFRITNWLTVYGRVNNILNQKYETNYGYTRQGFNVLGGFDIKF